MTEREVRRNLNKYVRYTNKKLYIENMRCILHGATILLGENGFYFQAILLDPTTENSVIICGLEEIESER